ncbi:MAG: hypothetical protein ACREOE_12705, partial [Gemmatimonadales bacterium]
MMRTAVGGWRVVSLLIGLCLSATACASGDGAAGPTGKGGSQGAGGTSGTAGMSGTSGTNPQDGPPAGYPDGHAAVPAAGQAE